MHPITGGVKMKKNRITIRNEFFVIGLISSLVISLVFICFFSFNLYQSSINEAKQKIMTSNLIMTTRIENLLTNMAMSANILGQDQLITDYTNRSTVEQRWVHDKYMAITKTNPNLKYCYSAYEDGTLVINDYMPPNGYDPTNRPWYLSAIKLHPDISIGLPYQDVLTSEWLISISKALVDDHDNITGVVALDSTLGNINKLMYESRYYESQSDYVINSHGTILVHPNLDYIGKQIEELSTGSHILFAKPSGFAEYSITSGKRLAYFKRLDAVDWIIVSALDNKEITKPIHIKVSLSVLFLAIVSIILGLLQVILYENRFVKPLYILKARIQEITSGKNALHEANQFSNYEIDEISQNIEMMAESSLNKKAYELRLILESTSDGILVLGEDKTIIHYNQRFLHMWNLEKVKPYQDYDELSKDKRVKSDDLEQIWGGNANQLDVIHLTNGNVFERFSCPVMDEGIIAGRLLSYRDITEKMRAEAQLKLFATTDDLTGLWNRRYFMEQSEYAFNQAKMCHSDLALIQLDIDLFKNINDTYGHAAGDDGLRFVGKALRELLRETDLVGRIGGEEFAILIVDTDPLIVKSLSEKIRYYFQSNTFTTSGQALCFTVSLGIAFYNADVKDIDQLLALADGACYKAKSSGRNQTYCDLPMKEML